MATLQFRVPIQQKYNLLVTTKQDLKILSVPEPSLKVALLPPSNELKFLISGGESKLVIVERFNSSFLWVATSDQW